MKILLVALLLLTLLSCGNNQSKNKTDAKTNTKELAKSLETANRYMVNEEEEEIENYVKRHNLDMIKTGTGLRYKVIKEGDGRQVTVGDLVTLQYELYTITDDLIYSSKTDGEKKFVVGHGEAESGLHELLPLLKQGSVVKAILPSHLAYGLSGDQRQIKQRNTLVYNIKVLEN